MKTSFRLLLPLFAQLQNLTFLNSIVHKTQKRKTLDAHLSPIVASSCKSFESEVKYLDLLNLRTARFVLRGKRIKKTKILLIDLLNFCTCTYFCNHLCRISSYELLDECFSKIQNGKTHATLNAQNCLHRHLLNKKKEQLIWVHFKMLIYAD